jgi:hypothetical protein
MAGEYDDGKAACRDGETTVKPTTSTRRLRLHHIVISVIAIVVAVALVLNYYLW